VIRRYLTPALIIALLVVGVAAATAAAARKPGGGNGGGTATTATLVPSCNPCAAGGVVHFSGSGYDASQGKALLDISGAITSTAVYADGTISFDWPYFGQPGSYSVKASQWSKGGKLVLKAETTVIVQ
jgi:hypothetical protein